MNQFFEGRNKETSEYLVDHKYITNAIFVNERPDKNLKVTNVHVEHSTFATIGFKGSSISDANLSFNVFIDCYFKDCVLSNVNFTGCKFINCIFDPKYLHNCTFDYAIFDNTHVKFAVMKPNLPREPNMRWKLCINLGLQALHAGDSKEYRHYFFEEKRASDEHYLNVVTQKSEYYKGKYGLYEQLEHVFKLIASKFNKLIWGYGERIVQLGITFIIIIFIYALIYKAAGHAFLNAQSMPIRLGFWQSVYQSACNYFNSSAVYTPAKMSIRVLSSTESFIGVIWTGFFIAALYKYINRR